MTIFHSETARGGETMLFSTKRAILATVGVMALCLGAEAALAQATTEPVVTSPPKSTPAEGETINTGGDKPGGTVDRATLAPGEEPTPANEGEITVTGTRIVRDGYSAPTPVSVISS